MTLNNEKKRSYPFVDGERAVARRLTTDALKHELKLRDPEFVPSKKEELRQRWFSAVLKKLGPKSKKPESNQEDEEASEDEEPDERVVPALKAWFRKHFRDFWVDVPQESWNAGAFTCDFEDGDDVFDEEPDYRCEYTDEWSVLLFSRKKQCYCSKHFDFDEFDEEAIESDISWDILQEQYEEFVSDRNDSLKEKEKRVEVVLREKALERMYPEAKVVRCAVDNCTHSETAHRLGKWDICYGCGRYCCYSCRQKSRGDELKNPTSILQLSGMACSYTCGTCNKTFCRECKPEFAQCNKKFIKCPCNQDYCLDETCVPGLNEWKNPSTETCDGKPWIVDNTKFPCPLSLEASKHSE